MNSSDRKAYILKKAQRDGIVSIPEAAAHFDVSVETIRRDVNVLCEQKKLTKVHGGAIPAEVSPIRRSARENSAKNEVIGAGSVGEYAAEMIRDGEIVMFDVGEAAQSVARAVKNKKNVTFITNSVTIASILLDKREAGDYSGRVILIGGELDAQGRFACSPDAYEEIGKYSADKAFITASAVSSKGVSSFNTYGSGYSAKIMEHSEHSILVTGSEKFGRKSLAIFAPLSRFSCVITDSGRDIPDEILNAAAKSDVEIKVIGTK